MKRSFLALTLTLALVATLAGSRVGTGQAMLRVVQAAPAAPPLDIEAASGTLFRSVAFKGVTHYAPLGAGPATLRLIAGGSRSPLASLGVELAPDAAYTAVAVGGPCVFEALVLVDDNAAPPPGQARVRFVHASPDAPPLDLVLGGSQALFQGIPFRGVGGYAAVDPGTHTLELRQAGAGRAPLAIADVTLDAGAVYTLYAVGPAGGQPGLQAVITIDASRLQPPTVAPTVAVARTVALSTPATGARPPGTTGRCCDASYTSTQLSRDACREHGGICEWWGQ